MTRKACQRTVLFPLEGMQDGIFSLSISWSGRGGLGIGTHPALIRGQSPAQMGFPVVLALTSLPPEWCFLHCGTMAMQWAQTILAAPLFLLPSASPFPWWERGPSTGEEVWCAVCWTSCCSYWAILSVNRNMRHNINHTESEVWIS